VFARHAPAATTAVLLQRAISTQVATGFCNETVYGKMNLLEVTGLVRMGAAEADAGRRIGAAEAVDDAEGSDADGSEAGVAAPRDVPFDAWPAASALNDKYHAECASDARRRARGGQGVGTARHDALGRALRLRRLRQGGAAA